MWQAEAKVLVENGGALANASFIALPETAASAKDVASVAGTPSDTASVTPTKHGQHKVHSDPDTIPSCLALDCYL